MRQHLETSAGTVHVGTRIRIVKMKTSTTPSRAFPDGIDHQAEAYDGSEGEIRVIDDRGQLFGTWGGLAVHPDEDIIEIIPKEK